MKRLILISLTIGLLMGCASTLTFQVETPADPTKVARVTIIKASDYTVKVNPDGTVYGIPNRWFSSKIFTDILNVLTLVK
jgi:hypothetical protein